MQFIFQNNQIDVQLLLLLVERVQVGEALIESNKKQLLKLFAFPGSLLNTTTTIYLPFPTRFRILNFYVYLKRKRNNYVNIMFQQQRKGRRRRRKKTIRI